MAFDTKDERLAMVANLCSPVPFALPEAAGSFTAQTAALMLQMFPAQMPEPSEEEVTAGASAQLPTRLTALQWWMLSR